MPFVGGETVSKYWMIICSLTNEKPFYDCENKWVIVYSYEQEVVRSPISEDVWYFGFAVIPDMVKDIPISTKYVGLKKFDDLPWLDFGNIKLDSCWDRDCKPLLWHELLHLKCNCAWHQNMTSYPLMK